MRPFKCKQNEFKDITNRTSLVAMHLRLNFQFTAMVKGHFCTKVSCTFSKRYTNRQCIDEQIQQIAH